PRAILLRAFKKESQLELWGAGSEAGPYVLLKSYGICATSGVLGPKRRFGDEQVPEGFYDLDWFNPQSNFFLSMHINYPNTADRVLGSRTNLGGDIFLHGNCASIGCIPITDDGIKEVYWLAVLAKDGGAKHLPIQIFPARLDERGFRELAKSHIGQCELIGFWSNLKEGFDSFEKEHWLADVHFAKDGRYEFSRETAGASGRCAATMKFMGKLNGVLIVSVAACAVSGTAGGQSSAGNGSLEFSAFVRPTASQPEPGPDF